jgi:hypothetical protein
MDARKVAADFAARAWYEECRAGQQAPDEAARFARESWTAFLHVACEGWGRLLLRVASQRAKRRERSRRTPALAG